MPSDTWLRYAFAVATTAVLLILFHVVQRLFSPRHTLKADAQGRNLAYLMVQAGHTGAVLMLVPGVVQEALGHDTLAGSVLWAAAFLAAGVLLIQLVGELGIRLLLRATLRHELESGNVAAGVSAAANYVAVGILAAPAIAGSDLQGLGLALAFFGLAVATHAAYVALFRSLTVYDDSEQIQGENLAAALSYAGLSVAVAVVLARALTGGEFVGWGPALRGYGTVAASALALYPVRQLIVQGLVLGRAPTLRGGALDQAIGAERNTAMAMLEALAYLATAVALVQLT
ncbi:MAG TPA: DUF350 domain-containing protein [Vicinamibacteria bacterium]